MTYYDPPEDRAGTVFDPNDETFGPIMAALQSGEFEKAARLTTLLVHEPHPVVCAPTITGLLGRLAGTEMLYIHDMHGEMVAMLIPRDGWWQKQLPEAPLDERFAHDHVRIDGRLP